MTDTEPVPNKLVELAKGFVWYEPDRSQIRTDARKFLQLAMAYATDADLAVIRRYFGDDDFRSALRAAPAGLFDAQSWRYWHMKLGIVPVPSRPRRPFSSPGLEDDDRFSKCVTRGSI